MESGGAPKEEFYERIVKGIREARRSVASAQEKVGLFRAQKNGKPGTPITEQWKEFTEQAESLMQEATKLHDTILRL